MIKTSICIIGGGNLAHVVGGYLAAKPDSEVRLLTRHPERWQADRTITITDCNNKVFKAHFTTISDDPSVTVKGVHIVLLCLPGFAIAPVLESIKPYLDSSTLVGSVVSSTGFFMMAQKILPSTVQPVELQQEISEKPVVDKNKGVVYKVQFTTKNRPVDNPQNVYKGLKDIDYYEHNGMFKYTAGCFSTKAEADKYLKEVVAKGYDSAFVVKFENGVRK